MRGSVVPPELLQRGLHRRSTPYDFGEDSLIAEFFASQSPIRLALAPPKPIIELPPSRSMRARICRKSTVVKWF
jgi:hypothetical protein